MFLDLIDILLFVRLKPDHQRERMNLELHTDGRELAVVGCDLNGTGRVCFLSGSRAASYRVCKRLIGITSWLIGNTSWL